jgi:hypothetical protein
MHSMDGDKAVAGRYSTGVMRESFKDRLGACL